jgi:hypothetical protein
MPQLSCGLLLVFVVCAYFTGHIWFFAPALIGCWGLTFWVWRRTRHFAEKFVRGRLCFRCAYPLRQTLTDHCGTGICPECGRQFNLAEYREVA